MQDLMRHDKSVLASIIEADRILIEQANEEIKALEDRNNELIELNREAQNLLEAQKPKIDESDMKDKEYIKQLEQLIIKNAINGDKK